MTEAHIDVDALINQGWLYKDFPRVRPAVWALIKEGLGEGNYHMLAEANYGQKRSDGELIVEWQRGQLLISPTGREAMSEFYRANKARFDAALADPALTYPSVPRLSPDGRYWICDQCGREWGPGMAPGCDPCAKAFDERDRRSA